MEEMRKHDCGASLLPEEWVTGVCVHCGGDTSAYKQPEVDVPDEDASEGHGFGCTLCELVQVPSETGVILVRECLL